MARIPSRKIVFQIDAVQAERAFSFIIDALQQPPDNPPAQHRVWRTAARKLTEQLDTALRMEFGPKRKPEKAPVGLRSRSKRARLVRVLPKPRKSDPDPLFHSWQIIHEENWVGLNFGYGLVVESDSLDKLYRYMAEATFKYLLERSLQPPGDPK